MPVLIETSPNLAQRLAVLPEAAQSPLWQRLQRLNDSLHQQLTAAETRFSALSARQQAELHLLDSVCRAWHVPARLILSRSRLGYVIQARRQYVALLHTVLAASQSQIARVLNRSRKTIAKLLHSHYHDVYTYPAYAERFGRLLQRNSTTAHAKYY